jgi:hypothetical protein
MGCGRHGAGCVRSRWGGNGVVRGTKAEAAGFRSREAAHEPHPDECDGKVQELPEAQYLTPSQGTGG